MLAATLPVTLSDPDQAKKACIRTPAPAVRNGSCGVDGHRTRSTLTCVKGESAIAEGIAMPSGSLLERR